MLLVVLATPVLVLLVLFGVDNKERDEDEDNDDDAVCVTTVEGAQLAVDSLANVPRSSSSLSSSNIISGTSSSSSTEDVSSVVTVLFSLVEEHTVGAIDVEGGGSADGGIDDDDATVASKVRCSTASLTGDNDDGGVPCSVATDFALLADAFLTAVVPSLFVGTMAEVAVFDSSWCIGCVPSVLLSFFLILLPLL